MSLWLPPSQAAPTGLYLGSTPVQAVYQGTSPVWSATPPGTYDATASGSQAGGTSISWTHTATAGADVYVWFCVDNNTATISVPKYGAATMTLLKLIHFNNSSSFGSLALYRAASVPGGASTVSATLSATTAATGCSVSYLDVSTVGTPATTFGGSTGTSASQSVTLSSGSRIIQAFGESGGSSRVWSSSTGGTNRFNGSVVHTGSTYCGLCVSDATATTTFGATLSGSNPNGWAAIAVILG